MKKKQYIANEGAMISDELANIAGQFIDIKFPDGQFTREQIVDIARPKKSPIHSIFEWDNTEAAEKWRLTQAGKLVTNLKIVIDDTTQSEFVSVRLENKQRVYMKTSKAKAIPNLWEQVMERAWKEILGWQKRHEKFSEFQPIVDGIKIVEKQRSKKWQRGKQPTKQKPQRKVRTILRKAKSKPLRSRRSA